MSVPPQEGELAGEFSNYLNTNKAQGQKKIKA